MARTSDGRTKLFFYFGDTGRVAEETSASGATKVLYCSDTAGRSLAEVKDGSWTWLLRDAEGSVATRLSDSGNVKSHSAYDPYGATNDAGSGISVGERDPETELGYQSESGDAITGNIIVGPRQYDPTTQRFTTADVFIDAGSDLSLATDPLTGNRYLFAAANPVALDDNGHEPCVSDCNRMYSGTKEQQRERARNQNFRAQESEADTTLAEHGYVSTDRGRRSAEAYQTGAALVPCGFEAAFDYLPDFRVTEAGPVMVKAAGECTMFPDTGPVHDFQNACKTHDYGYDLLRADVLDGSGAVDDILHRHASANCSGRWFGAAAACRETADLVLEGVHVFGWSINFESRRLEGFDYSAVDASG